VGAPITISLKNQNSTITSLNDDKTKKRIKNCPVKNFNVRTRQGFLPGQKKTNQDSYII
jgi:hypothetical protein